MSNLTGNELALAQMATQLAIAWWEARQPSNYRKQEIAKLSALNAKLNTILDGVEGAITQSDGACIVMVMEPTIIGEHLS